MKLKDLYPSVDASLSELEVGKVTNNSQKVDAGDVFVRGTEDNGHIYAQAAVEAGAAVVVCDQDLGLPNQLIVEQPRQVYAEMCAAYFGHPAKKIKLIGVTGTNGKTSTCLMIKSLLESFGYKTGLIGTVQNMVGEQVLPAHNTTPGAYELHSLFSLMERSGCEYAVMEVSSHAIDQQRIHGLHFACCVYTNLSQDHLDYHKTMENYLQVKQRLFACCDHAIVNVDDSYAQNILEACRCPVTTYAVKTNESDFVAKNLRKRADGVDFEMLGDSVIGRVKLKVPGEFSVYNAMAAGSCVITLGMPFAQTVSAMCQLESPKGRAEVVPVGDRDFTVIIDYAHTPDGLENILNALRSTTNGRLVTVFGCGGDRDKTKRPLMGEIAADLSDYVIVTSDNPRTEDPGEIIKDITAGIKKSKSAYTVIENRIKAIEYAILNAQSNDTILLAGKGHETYQILGHQTIRLDEREVVAKALEKLQ